MRSSTTIFHLRSFSPHSKHDQKKRLKVPASSDLLPKGNDIAYRNAGYAVSFLFGNISCPDGIPMDANALLLRPCSGNVLRQEGSVLFAKDGSIPLSILKSPCRSLSVPLNDSHLPRSSSINRLSYDIARFGILSTIVSLFSGIGFA